MGPEEFRLAYEALNISQAEMARRLKVSTTTTNRWANGLCPISYPVELAIKQMLADHERDEVYAGEDITS